MMEDPNKFLHEKLQGWPEKEWHEYGVWEQPKQGLPYMECLCCGHRISYWKDAKSNPTYRTMPVDHLIQRLVEIGEWVKFVDYVNWNHCPTELDTPHLYAWLCQQPRFTNLMLQYFPGYEGEMFKEDGK